MQDMYRNYVSMVCTRTMKNIVTLSLEEEVCFVLLDLLRGFPFFGNWCFMCFLPFL
jgi:hypothetical protein